LIFWKTPWPWGKERHRPKKRISGYSPGWWPGQSRCNWIWCFRKTDL